MSFKRRTNNLLRTPIKGGIVKSKKVDPVEEFIAAETKQLKSNKQHLRNLLSMKFNACLNEDGSVP